MEKKKKIEDLYFKEKMSLTEIANQLNVSISYISRILRENIHYKTEQERRKAQNKATRREKQKELIYKLRKNKLNQNLMENQQVKEQHKQATKELSKRKTIGNEALRKWCSLYKYDKKKKRYVFDTKKALKPNDYPMYIKV